jgi:hypothetical protein
MAGAQKKGPTLAQLCNQVRKAIFENTAFSGLDLLSAPKLLSRRLGGSMRQNDILPQRKLFFFWKGAHHGKLRV